VEGSHSWAQKKGGTITIHVFGMDLLTRAVLRSHVLYAYLGHRPLDVRYARARFLDNWDASLTRGIWTQIWTIWLTRTDDLDGLGLTIIVCFFWLRYTHTIRSKQAFHSERYPRNLPLVPHTTIDLVGYILILCECSMYCNFVVGLGGGGRVFVVCRH